MDLTDINARFEPAIDAESEAALRLHRLSIQVAAVRRRSRFIKLMRTVFPGAIVALLLLNVGWIIATSIISSLNVYGGNTGEIRMTNPRFIGQSGVSGHYTISGLEAIRKGKDSQVFALKAPNMDFQNGTAGTTHLQANGGVYDLNARQFVMNGAVNISGADFAFKTEDATADLANSTIHGDKHVEGTNANVHIEGESFVISNSGKDVQFSGQGNTQVHAVIQNP